MPVRKDKVQESFPLKPDGPPMATDGFCPLSLSEP